ncbi:FAD-dependent oxidoreductase [Leucobacter muris]|uniref:FAD-dependent oxidoreductase n=1 Tax=Leucobacter muris TaxID=1935379 RepID=A0ABX5QI99_9MICO|nr:FAD-dependent oxidoreductase [Leucobacter muris]QAB18809.1 FAD-dependent oxidoreductase [Leucobacter muris]
MSDTAIVIGAGAWGLPTALQLQDRGWRVTLIERFDAGGPYASSGGSTRLWRLADTRVWRARAMLGTLGAMERLSERLGTPVFRRTGLLWRDHSSLPDVAQALASIGQPVERVAADRVAERFAGLRPDGRDALFVEQAGVVLADRLLREALAAFTATGGRYRPSTRATGIEPGVRSVRVALADGDALEADQVLVAAGPGTAELLPGLDLALPLTPYIEQVVTIGDPAASPPAPDLPGLIDCPTGDAPGVYAMPNGAAGYKVGLDQPLRPLAGGTLGDDLDRAEHPRRTEQIRARVERDLTAVPPRVLATQVCTWTDSGDGDFIVGRTHPRVVLACGDSGEGFKYAAFMGEYLADLIEGGAGDPEFQRRWRPGRFGRDTPPRTRFDAIGRH